MEALQRQQQEFQQAIQSQRQELLDLRALVAQGGGAVAAIPVSSVAVSGTSPYAEGIAGCPIVRSR
jgi:hypothetical protein